jgi:hypothetical protein
MIYEESAPFRKDLKRLCKKFPSLPGDLENLKKYGIELFHAGIADNRSIVLMAGFCNDGFTACKVRKIACRSLKSKGSKSGLRLIYVYEKSAGKITFLELYFKGEKENEDRNRIEDFISLFNEQDREQACEQANIMKNK